MRNTIKRRIVLDDRFDSVSSIQDCSRQLSDDSLILREQAKYRPQLHLPSRSRSKQNKPPQKAESKSENIKVLVRVRPALEKEEQSEQFQIFGNSIAVNSQTYSFDRLFLPTATQAELFQTLKPGILKVKQGFNCAVFAYGMTGSGKTYTMFGQGNGQEGIIPRSADLLIQTRSKVYTFTCSMMEIYKQTVCDLLQRNKPELKIKQNTSGFYVDGLTEVQVDDRLGVLSLLEFGESQRKTACTRLNSKSSRSHTIFILRVKSKQSLGRLTLVDLAGCENVQKSGASGEVLEQAKKINLSLSCLGKVINSLTLGNDHVPFRDSKLTKILQESFSGNSITSLVVNISFADNFLSQTTNALKFALRAKLVKTEQRRQVLQESEVVRLREQVRRLTQQLQESKQQLEQYRARERQGTFSTSEQSEQEQRLKTRKFYIDLLD